MIRKFSQQVTNDAGGIKRIAPVGFITIGDDVSAMEDVFFVNDEWIPSVMNPFTSDGAYGNCWSAFIYDQSISGYTNFFPEAKVYSLAVNPGVDSGFHRLKDFVSYETRYRRNVILKTGALCRNEVLEKLQNTNDTERIREIDPKWLVHSTTLEAWQAIQREGALLSPSMLKCAGKEVTEIGLQALLEPADYSDYVMLDVLDGCGELVVNSRKLGYVCTDPGMPYTPGIRLYFNAHEIIKDGLGVRDGLHVLKVYHKLPLERYMVMGVDSNKLENCRWTPSAFTGAANQYFLDHISACR
jgi:hypothetical protein